VLAAADKHFAEGSVRALIGDQGELLAADRHRGGVAGAPPLDRKPHLLLL
jgi:hypothetical protein